MSFTPKVKKKPNLSASILDPWKAIVKSRTIALVGGGTKFRSYFRLKFGAGSFLIEKAQETRMFVRTKVIQVPVAWKDMSLSDYASLSGAAAAHQKKEVEAQLAAAMLMYADGRDRESENFFNTATVLDAAATAKAKGSLGFEIEIEE